MTFNVTKTVDDAGVATYYAKRESDIDSSGLSVYGSPIGVGETKADAIVDLSKKLVIIEKNKALANK